MGGEALMDLSFYYPSDQQTCDRVFGRPAPVCVDCGTTTEVRVSTPVHGGRWHCDPCWRWRAQHGYEFDPRPIQLLAKDVA